MAIVDDRQRIRDACEQQDRDALASIIDEMDKKGTLDVYLKALFVTKEPDEIYDLLGLFDPNRMISGGSLAASISYHSNFGLQSRRFQREVLALLFSHGAEPNSSFSPTVAMEDAESLSIFSMAIIPDLLKIPYSFPVSLDTLVGLMCRAGLKLEDPDEPLSKLQQVTLAVSPLHMLDKAVLEKRRKEIEHEATDASTKFSASAPTKTHLPDEELFVQIAEVYNQLAGRGGNLLRKFERNSGVPEELAGKTVIEAVDFYRDLLSDPESLKAWLTKNNPLDWSCPEHDLSPNTIRVTQNFYAALSKGLRIIYKEQQDLVSKSTSDARSL